MIDGKCEKNGRDDRQNLKSKTLGDRVQNHRLEESSPYRCDDHQYIIEVKAVDLNLSKHPKNYNQGRYDHRDP